MAKHIWVYKWCDNHKGEYWYDCVLCGMSDWIRASDEVSKDWHSHDPCKPIKPIKQPKPIPSDEEVIKDLKARLRSVAETVKLQAKFKLSPEVNLCNAIIKRVVDLRVPRKIKKKVK